MISIKHGYLLVDIHVLRASIVDCRCMDILVWISMWIFTLVGELKTDIQKSWISKWITVDFWKSMHGYAVDRTMVGGERWIARDRNSTVQLTSY